MTKTSTMSFSLGRVDKQDPVIAALTEKGMGVVDECKFLGITVDRGLQWDPHINQLCSKLNSAIYAIKKVKEICGVNTAKSVYHAYFHSVMSYGVMFWGMGSGSLRAFILQKRAIRTLLGMSPRDSCRESFKQLGILTLPSAYIYECLLYAHSNMVGTPLNSHYHNHDTRNKDLIRPIGHRLAKMSKSFICMSVRLHNKLPDDLRSLASESFPKEVKKYLVAKVFYSTDEMLNE